MALRFKLDENLPIAVKAALVIQGHDALTALDQSLGGEEDRKIAAICAEEDRILVTLDLDFSDIRESNSGMRSNTRSKPYARLCIRSNRNCAAFTAR